MTTPLYHNFAFSSQKLQDSVSIEIALPKEYDEFPNEEYTSIYYPLTDHLQRN